MGIVGEAHRLAVPVVPSSAEFYHIFDSEIGAWREAVCWDWAGETGCPSVQVVGSCGRIVDGVPWGTPSVLPDISPTRGEIDSR